MSQTQRDLGRVLLVEGFIPSPKMLVLSPVYSRVTLVQTGKHASLIMKPY